MGVRERGYVALLAVLIVGAVTTSIGVTLLLLGVDSQKSVTTSSRAVQARGLAHACAEEALQVLHDNNVYTGNGNMSMGQGTCTYTVANPGGYNRTITATGTVSTVVQRVSLSVTLGSTITVSTWQEVQ